MSVVIRVDSSTQIGSGHVMRCLTLADILTKKKSDIYFICRELAGNLCDFIEKKGYFVYRMLYDEKTVKSHSDESTRRSGETWGRDAKKTCQILREIKEHSNISCLIVDHYGLDGKWESTVRPFVEKIIVIDDLANRRHDCDLLLDQNLYYDIEGRYKGLVSDSCKLLLGPRYALLRPEFYEARKKLKQRDGIIRRIFVFFGGSDPTNETAKALRAIQQLNRADLYVDVVVGSINPHKKQIEQVCQSMKRANFYCQVNNMAELMAQADLAIGAGGATTWERCFLGLPCIILIVAENQKKVTERLAEMGLVINLGQCQMVSSTTILNQLNSLLEDPMILKKIGAQCFELMRNQTSILPFIIK